MIRTPEERIDKMAYDALTEIRRMAESAREEINRRFAFIARSHGQRVRFIKQRMGSGNGRT